MEFDVVGNPDFGGVRVQLARGESLISEGGAMATMDAHLALKARLLGGFLRSVARRFAGGQSFLLAEYNAEDAPGEVVLSPRLPGEVRHQKLMGESLLITAGSFLAATPSLVLDTKFGGLKSFFSGEGMFLIEARGLGDVFFSSYGAIIEKRIEEPLRVDTGHLVAWEPSLDYKVRGMGGLKQTFFSGEGFVLEFSGRGRVWLQTRTIGETAGWITPYLRV